MDSVTVSLSQPLTLGDKSYSELTFKAPRVGDLRGLKLVDLIQMDVRFLLGLLPRICTPHITEDHVQALPATDLFQCFDRVNAFFMPAASRTTSS